jgi:hypothetical protein
MNMYSDRTRTSDNKTNAGPPVISSEGLLLQRKLAIGAVNDPLETEADAMADRVMRMPDKPLVQRKCAECEEEDKKVQRKPLASQITPFIQTKPSENVISASDNISRHIETSSGGGSPLPATTRNFMESRFGSDFSSVKIHTGSAAVQMSRELNARAFTMGGDIFFNEGQYAPESSKGKKLLAHELTHTIQQGASGKDKAIQRLIQVESGVTLDTMGYTVTKSGNFYTCPRVEKSSIFHEIFTGLLNSARIFKLKGNTNSAANANLKKHIAARQGVVNFAAKKKYTFAAGAGFTMNPDYWIVDHAAGTFYPKPGVKRDKAIEDLNVHPEQYKIACEAATALTEEGGGKSPILVDTGGGNSDWIPADWGYIKNTNFPASGGTPGEEGENIIYVGKDKFWGHFGPGIEYKTLTKWFDQVKSWNGGAEITDIRKYPSAGLD